MARKKTKPVRATRLISENDGVTSIIIPANPDRMRGVTIPRERVGVTASLNAQRLQQDLEREVLRRDARVMMARVDERGVKRTAMGQLINLAANRILDRAAPVGAQDGDPPEIPGDIDITHWDGTGLLHGGFGRDNEFTRPGAKGDPYKEELMVPPMPIETKSCRENCAENDKLAKEHCNVIRKRVAKWMKDSGCPSSVRGFKRKAKAACATKVKVKAR